MTKPQNIAVDFVDLFMYEITTEIIPEFDLSVVSKLYGLCDDLEEKTQFLLYNQMEEHLRKQLVYLSLQKDINVK